MKHANGKNRFMTCFTILGCIGIAILSSEVVADSGTPDNFDNQGKKIFDAQRATPEINLTADSGGRNLAGFYSLQTISRFTAAYSPSSGSNLQRQ